ncbi:MAG: hypothetical protein QNJ74_14800 [Trichodesmium sp. MO_231.B1]|nr:hypothetical protein [Trichodesmium sp. MO_231.B1]
MPSLENPTAISTTLRIMVRVALAKSQVVATPWMVWLWAVVVAPPLPTSTVMGI